MFKKEFIMKRVLAVFLVVLLFAAILSGCKVYVPGDCDTRFNIISESLTGDGGFVVFEDTETGVMYVFYKAHSGGGLSVLYNPDGTIMTRN